MKIRLPLYAALIAALAGCSSDRISSPPPPPPPPSGILLKDVEYDRLPSPYYHFEYADEAGKLSTASFASGLATYAFHYAVDKLNDIDIGPGNTDKLFYTYDDAGRVAAIRARDASGANTQLWFFTYDGAQLTSLERDRAVTGGFVVELTMSFVYDANGNLLEAGTHYPAIEGLQTETTLVDLYENYDDNVAVDDFDILHPGFFDKLTLLPGVKLQHGNPAHVIHLGDGSHFTVDYTYTYNDQKRPLRRNGTLLFQTGPDAGKSFAIGATYTYY